MTAGDKRNVYKETKRVGIAACTYTLCTRGRGFGVSARETACRCYAETVLFFCLSS